MTAPGESDFKTAVELKRMSTPEVIVVASRARDEKPSVEVKKLERTNVPVVEPSLPVNGKSAKNGACGVTQLIVPFTLESRRQSTPNSTKRGLPPCSAMSAVRREAH